MDQSDGSIANCKYVHTMFERQAALTPDRIALVWKDYYLTYRAVNEYSNQLAQILQNKRIGPETVVGIYVKNPAKTVIALLAVFKAGGAYAPLNMNDPSPRINSILHISKIQYVIVEGEVAPDLEFDQRTIINLDTIFYQVGRGYNGNLDVDINPQNIAYVIHTSGTTGEPKGVAMSHEAFHNLIFWHAKTFGGDNLRTLLFTSFSFDASNQELFSTICVGGVLYLTDDIIRKDPFALANFLQEHSIQRMLMFYAPLQHLIDAANRQNLAFDLCEVITAGEPIKITAQLLTFFSRHKGCRFFNMYGLTETHTVTGFEFPQNPNSWPTDAPIGCPIDHTHIHLFDEQNEIVNIGECGELGISGISLARGYFMRPDLTAERFLSNPVGDRPGDRIYLTGDIGRELSDGSFVCFRSSRPPD